MHYNSMDLHIFSGFSCHLIKFYVNCFMNFMTKIFLFELVKLNYRVRFYSLKLLQVWISDLCLLDKDADSIWMGFDSFAYLFISFPFALINVFICLQDDSI